MRRSRDLYRRVRRAIRLYACPEHQCGMNPRLCYIDAREMTRDTGNVVAARREVLHAD